MPKGVHNVNRRGPKSCLTDEQKKRIVELFKSPDFRSIRALSKKINVCRLVVTRYLNVQKLRVNGEGLRYDFSKRSPRRGLSFDQKLAVIITHRLITPLVLAKAIKSNRTTVARYMKEVGLWDYRLKFRGRPPNIRENRKIYKTEEEVDNYLKENFLKEKIFLSELCRRVGRERQYVVNRIVLLGLFPGKEIAYTYNWKGKDVHVKRYSLVGYAEYEGRPKQVWSGRLPNIPKPIGSRRAVRHSCGIVYMRIKVAEKDWRYEHKVRWEEVNGKVLEGHCLRCVTKDTCNTDPSNWRMVPYNERNTEYYADPMNYTDKQIAGWIGRGNKDLRPLIVQDKTLIKAKRIEIIINRKIKEHVIKHQK